MKNVGMKPESYRIATASSELFAPPHCLQLLAEGNTEKGDALKQHESQGFLQPNVPMSLFRFVILYLFIELMSI